MRKADEALWWAVECELLGMLIMAEWYLAEAERYERLAAACV